MFLVLGRPDTECNHAQMRGDRGCPPIAASRLFHRFRLAFCILLLLCLTLPTAGWAALPPDESPVGSPSSPAAIQAVTWTNFAPGGWVNVLPLGSSITASSAAGLQAGGDAYSISTNGGTTWSAWSTSDLSTSAPNANTHNITVTGLTFPNSATSNLIRFRTYETGGVEAVSPGYIVRVDTVAPDPPTRLAGSPARRWTNANSFSESWQNPSDVSGITGAYYRLNGPPASPTDGTYVPTLNTISNIAVPGDGKHDIYIWLVDAAGNVDSTAWSGDPDVFWYDGTLPVSTATLTPPWQNWYTTTVRISFAATDLPQDSSNPPLVYTRLNSAPWTATTALNLTAEGPYFLQYQARDKAGNVEPEKTLLFGIDMTPPTVSLTADRLPNASGWYTDSVDYTLSVSDSGSDVFKGYYRLNNGAWQAGTGFTLAAQGLHRIDYYGQDNAGNTSAITTKEVQIDTTAPVTSREADGTPGENGWYVSDVTVRLLPTDNVSGVAQTRYRINEGGWQNGLQFPLTSDGIHRASYYSVDKAGNPELPVLQEVKLDTAAPGAPTALSAAPAGWSHTNTYTVTWTVPNDLSGVAGAYYKLGVAPTGPRDGAFISGTTRIENLAVPAEGANRLYLWLRDGAGNADHTTAPATGPILYYDATAPTTSIQLQGNAGLNSWYRSPVTVTLSATDSASGIVALHHRINKSEWQSTAGGSAVIAFSQVGKYLLEYYAEDLAGNVEAVKTRSLNLDFTAPGTPSKVSVLPVGWTNSNGFQLEWTPVAELSGVAGAYVRFGSAPSKPNDGTFYAGSTKAEGVEVPGEGRHTAYVWLADAAGNTDHATSVVLGDSMWYDATPPVSVITQTGAPGPNGWYVEPVKFVVSASDTASGVREIRHKVDDGPWVSGAPFTFGEDGHHTIRISAVDIAGNEESAHAYELAMDRTPPEAAFAGSSSYQSNTSFEVIWSGTDGVDGSGIAYYDLQVRHGYDGAWQEWLTQTQLSSARFDGQRGHTYFFQIFARDRAGNRQQVGGVLRVLVEPILNGGFDTGALTDWDTSGYLYMAVVPVSGPGDKPAMAARLGTEDYGPSLEVPGTVPVGSATISQTIGIPASNQVRDPCLSFWYRVLTYDVMYSQRLERYIDTFDVTLNTVDGQEIALLLRDGNPTNEYGSLYDTGWKAAMIDLKPYSGRTVQLAFANWNRNDNLLNTWSFVDEIQIRECNRTFAPFIVNSSVGGAAATSEPAQSAGLPTIDRNSSIR